MKKRKIASLMLGIIMGFNIPYDVQAVQVQYQQAQVNTNINLTKTNSSEAFYNECTKLVQQYAVEQDEITALEANTLSQFATKRLIIKAAHEQVEWNGCNPIKTLKGPDNIFIMQFETLEDTRDTYEQLSVNEGIVYVEPDQYITIDTEISGETNKGEKSTPKSWGVKHIEADQYAAYLNKQNLGNRVTVAVVDSGVDMDHPFLAGRIKSGGYDFVQRDTIPEDEHGHGTHVAGTVVDCTPGLNIDILPIRVLDSQNRGTLLNAINGIRYATEKGADIINFSIYMNSHSMSLDDALKEAISKGVTPIICAGNFNTDTGTQCPAHLNDAIIVSAIDSRNNKAYFSNYGYSVDVAAPGVSIYSSYLYGGYTYMDGTSMATPHVAATAAMYKLENPSLTPKQIEEKITTHTQDLGTPGKDKYFGSGVPKLSGALPKVPLESIQLSETVLTLDKGTWHTLKVTYNPEDTTDSKNITWSTSNPNSVSVNTYGQLSAIEVGSAIITAQVGEQTATCEVTVTGKSSNANLKDIQTSQGTLEPAFDPSILDYTLKLEKEIEAITLEAQVESETASVLQPTLSYLPIGVTPVQLIVTAEDGTQKTYTVTINKGTSPETDFEFKEGVITKYRGPGGEVVIPSSINGIPVKSIGSYAFRSYTTLESISIHVGVKELGYKAFDNCINLKQITLPDRVSINWEAFGGCSNVDSVTIHYGNQNIENITYENWKTALRGLGLDYAKMTAGYICNAESIKQVHQIDESNFVFENGIIKRYKGNSAYVIIPSSINGETVTGIEIEAFRDNKQLANIIIPDTVQEIGSSAFSGCTSLQYVTLPQALQTISNRMFYNCGSLKTIVIQEGVEEIGRSAFNNCRGITELNLPNSLKIIGEAAFLDCKGLTEVTIPTGVELIDAEAFAWCDNLQSVTIPKRVTSIADNAFKDDAKLTLKVYKGSYAENYAIKNSISHQIIAETMSTDLAELGTDYGQLNPAFNPDVLNYGITIPYEIDQLTITAKTVSEAATVIGTGAYPLQVGENTLVITVQSADENYTKKYQIKAYREKEGTAPAEHFEFGEGRIIQYTGLGGNVIVPATINGQPVKIIDPRAFEYSKVTTIELPKGLTEIREEAFYSCRNLSSINLPEELSHIGRYAFAYCTSLKDVAIPGRVTQVQDNAFYNCSNLTSIYIPEGVTRIGKYAFGVCNKLESITLPNSVTTVDEYAFIGCTLKDIELPGEGIILATNAFSNNVKKSVTLNYGDKEISELGYKEWKDFITNQMHIEVSQIENGYLKNNSTTKQVKDSQYNNPNLISLNVSQGTLDPVFNAAMTEYRVEVSNEVAEITVDATPEIEKATVEGTGNYPLQVGENIIQVTVTAADEVNTRTYTLVVIRHEILPSSNADLQALTVSEGTLNPTFDPQVKNYTIEVENEIASIQIGASPQDEKAKVEGIGEYPLQVGENTIQIQVTAEDSTTQAYEIIVTRKAIQLSSNANLSYLGIDQGTLSPAFEPNQFYYYVRVPNDIQAITIEAIAEDEKAIVQGAGLINVTPGPNPVDIIVTAEDGTTQSYLLDISRDYSNNTNLASLTVDQGTLSPKFDPSIKDYTVAVSNAVENIRVNAMVEDEYATVQGAGEYALQVGENTITLVVTAGEGSQGTYTLSVMRDQSSNNNLSYLGIEDGWQISPQFDKDILSYTLQVENHIELLVIQADAEHPEAKVEGTGRQYLETGDNKIDITVTAQDETVKTYTIIVTRARSNNSRLATLTLNQGQLDPEFWPDTLNYTVSVPNEQQSIMIEAEAEHLRAKVQGTGEKSLSTGNNTFEIVVTAEDESTTTYTVVVIRALSNDTRLGSLVLSEGTLQPAFDPGITNYSVLVPNEIEKIDVQATAYDAMAMVLAGGPGEYILPVGETTITLVVAAEDGTQQAHTIVVTRKASNNAKLNALTVSEGKLNPEFNPDQINYTATVAHEVESITIQAVAADAEAKVEGTGKYPLQVGKNTILIQVTAADGTTQSYTIYVFRDYMKQDVNHDSRIDEQDLEEVSEHYNETDKDTGWQELYDFNQDGVIDIFDLVMISNQFKN